MDNILITIFTPAFNRAEQLKKLYDSLINQSNQRFVWLIVDDGSVDNTAELVSLWSSEGKIKIRYYYQENQGKHIAHNTGVMNTDTEYFFCVDSDDELTSDAIESIYDTIIDIHNRTDIAGIIAKRGFHNGIDQCTELPDNISEASIKDIYRIHKLKGELAMVFKIKVLREYLFPVFSNEKFVGENAIFNLISMKYKMKLMKKVIYLGEYLPDGYTRNLTEVHKNNPKGYLYCLTQEIDLARSAYELKYAYANYISGCWKIGFKVRLDRKCYFKNMPGAIVLYIKQIIKNRMAKSLFLRSILRQVFKIKYI